LSTYLAKEISGKDVYFNKVLRLIEEEDTKVTDDANFIWLKKVNIELQSFKRNEFAHNNSLLMQDFIPYFYDNAFQINSVDLPHKLLHHNNCNIVYGIFKLIKFLEYLEEQNKKL
jgi:uncharacterized FlgJ-related protein